MLLVLKAALGFWLALVLFAASRAHPRSFLGAAIHRRVRGYGVVILLLAIASLVIAVELFRLRPWARTGAFVLEGISIAAALTRISARPGQVVVSLAFSAAVILLLLTSSASSALEKVPSRGPRPPGSAPPSG
ncbi:MAG: hypothetical protein JO085_06470 [Acidimicrobiia bacterium]|nr:hypothetical protein [Acidimicrobiia bacterium]